MYYAALSVLRKTILIHKYFWSARIYTGKGNGKIYSVAFLYKKRCFPILFCDTNWFCSSGWVLTLDIEIGNGRLRLSNSVGNATLIKTRVVHVEWINDKTPFRWCFNSRLESCNLPDWNAVSIPHNRCICWHGTPFAWEDHFLRLRFCGVLWGVDYHCRTCAKKKNRKSHASVKMKIGVKCEMETFLKY